MSKFLGLDASTQSVTAIVIDTEAKKVVLDETVNFGLDLPQYDSPNGFLPHPDELVKHSDPLMWVDALELLLKRCQDKGFDWSQVDGISGSGQQHGSVYLNGHYADRADWHTDSPLVEQVQDLLSRATSPIWMDSSTSEECEEISAMVGGDEIVTRVTGSRPIERFTGPQIRRFFKEQPNAYAETARIHLVSSFMAYLLCGSDVPIDYGDGAGMNLLDLASGSWSPRLLDATAPGLRDRLPLAVPSDTQVGTLASYFSTTYGFRPGIPIIAFSGDNPNSLVGMGATEPGTAVISLGTSDTVFAAMREPRTDPAGYGHVFGNPAGGFMCLIAFKNGSLAREEVREQYDLSWEDFAEFIQQKSVPGNNGNLMLYYYVPEITPLILSKTVELYGDQEFCNGTKPAATVRAIVEAQAMSMKLHSAWIGETPTRLLVTGGASRNAAIRQVLADVFQAEIVPQAVSNSAGLGAALRAANAIGGYAWDELYASFAQPDTAHAARPHSETASLYEELSRQFARKLEPYVG